MQTHFFLPRFFCFCLNYSSGYKISLEAIDAHRKGKDPEDEQQALCFKLYDEMLAANNAAAITFVCQKELRFPRGTRQLDDDQLNRCHRVYRFMNERDNYDCVCSNAYLLFAHFCHLWVHSL